ncbi:MAG: MBL fold metallo-hydrolase [Bacteroidales bacterium]|nr:MBL fold metallo-hydrolase [Bacteroidales bacterium]
MQRERISDNVFWFQSDVYAQVTAGVIAGPKWAMVIDTLAIPEETLGMRDFIEDTLKLPVRYVINTHYHADHTWGNCFFPGATIFAHQKCRDLLISKGFASLEETKKQNPSFKNVKIVLPHTTFNQGKIKFSIGKKTLSIFHTPGNSPDGISILVEEDRVLFAGDAMLPIPYIIDGDLATLKNSLKEISSYSLENIVQGHGDIVLRGEVESSIENNIQYLNNLENSVSGTLNRRNPEAALKRIKIEDCGKDKVLLGGLANELHWANLVFLFNKMKTN